MKTSDVKIIKLKTVGSTNTYLKELAKKGEKAPAVVIAESQTGGKGTKNRSFSSEKGGVYLSILVNPHLSGFDATMITSMTAVAVSESIDEIGGCDTKIKWVNDIYLEGKKVCGILCESVVLPDGTMPFIVVGIGVNLFLPRAGFPDEIKDIATSVFKEETDGIKEKFINLLLENFFKYFENASSKTFLEKYRAKNLVLGKNVSVLQGNIALKARALSIDDSCRLLVEFADKSQKLLSSAEVSLKL